uniref:NADH-ubiquinone oxidoreductase chain 4L n=1 Tax=Nesomachilis australica TaxID=299218 RepID=Q5C844_9INSE|nr:NADH dehydrogenase subunit 4L [Nesomachilis australica]AAV50272.1 NADH dehydrogenase subunit 4L [Nesomachilis australica]
MKFFVCFVLSVFFVVMSGCYTFVAKRKHLLTVLFSLEFMMLGLFSFLSVMLVFYSADVYLVLVFLTFVACEGSLGLSILVCLVRTHGNDYFMNFSVLQC